MGRADRELLRVWGDGQQSSRLGWGQQTPCPVPPPDSVLGPSYRMVTVPSAATTEHGKPGAWVTGS